MPEFWPQERNEIAEIARSQIGAATEGRSARVGTSATTSGRRGRRLAIIPIVGGGANLRALIQRELATAGTGRRSFLASTGPAAARERLPRLPRPPAGRPSFVERFRLRQRALNLVGQIPLVGPIAVRGAGVLATGAGAAAAGAASGAVVLAILAKFQLNMLNRVREAIDLQVRARGLLTRSEMNRAVSATQADGTIASWRRWSSDKMNVVGRAFAFNRRLAGALMEGFDGVTAYAEGTRAFWDSNLELHPAVTSRLQLMRNRFDRQVQEGTFYGGWKTGGSEGPGG